MSSICGTTDTPVLGFWWHLHWVFKLRRFPGLPAPSIRLMCNLVVRLLLTVKWWVQVLMNLYKNTRHRTSFPSGYLDPKVPMILFPHEAVAPLLYYISPPLSVHFYRLQTKFGGKVIFSQACVKNSVHREVPGPGGVSVLGGRLVPGGGLLRRGAWWRPPPPWLLLRASYWNAFLLHSCL